MSGFFVVDVSDGGLCAGVDIASGRVKYIGFDSDKFQNLIKAVKMIFNTYGDNVKEFCAGYWVFFEIDTCMSRKLLGVGMNRSVSRSCRICFKKPPTQVARLPQDNSGFKGLKIHTVAW